MKKRQKATTTPSTTTTTTQQPRKSPNTSTSSPDTSPLEEHAPSAPNGVDAQGDGSRMARSSASSKLQVPYPEHLSTIRHDKSPVPPPSESSLSSGASGEKRVRADSENSSRKQNVRKRGRRISNQNSKHIDTPRYCRNMVSKMLVKWCFIYILLIILSLLFYNLIKKNSYAKKATHVQVICWRQA